MREPVTRLGAAPRTSSAPPVLRPIPRPSAAMRHHEKRSPRKLDAIVSALEAMVVGRQYVTRGRRLDGQRELKGRTPSCGWGRQQMAAMRRDDPPTDGQSHARALRFRGVVGLENALSFIDGKPDASIAHRDQWLITLGPLGCDR